jgi:hypothetical protein
LMVSNLSELNWAEVEPRIIFIICKDYNADIKRKSSKVSPAAMIVANKS